MWPNVNADELRGTIRSFLDLVTSSSSSAQENEQTLPFLLDQLALATHGTKPTGTVTDSEAPRREYDALRAQVILRFPNYGLYRAAGTEPDDEFLVGDAIDDITDIAKDLSEVEWLWEKVGETDALWQFHFGFESHWGSHLRELQWYIHELKTTG
jgi:hypothetical protein